MQYIDIKENINNSPMGFFQFFAIAICVLISLIDGFDVLTIAFVAPAIAEQWSLSSEQLGVLFSASLVGMVVGALVISPLADKVGRRFIVLSCLLILTLGMFASGFTTTHLELVITRLFTGLGMGAILPSITTIVAEYASHRSRALAVSIMAVGYTVGTVIGGVISIYLINSLGWQYVFFCGGIASAIMVVIVFYQLPESVDFILTKNSPKSLKKLNTLLKKLNLETCSTFPYNPVVASKPAKNFALLLTPTMLKATILLCISNFMLMCSFYFLASWMPKILVSLGYDKEVSITGSLIMNISGIVGGLALGWLSKKYSLQKVTALMLVGAFMFVVAFGLSDNILLILFVLMAVIGFSIFGAMAGLYALAPAVFPTQIRATGTGIVLGIARIGAALGPYVAGLLIAAELSRGYYFFILALPLLLSAMCVYVIKTTRKQ